MPQDEDIQVVGTMTDYLIEKLMDEEQNQEFAFDYFKSAFVTSAVNALFYMRRQAGLTQAQVAERLNTKQSAIARLEGDFDGGISLRRYVDFALSCGMVPHNITFAPLQSVISYTIAQPKVPYTQVNYQEWLKENSQPTPTSTESVVQVKGNFDAMNTTLQAQNQAVFSIESSLERSSTNIINLVPYTTTLQDVISMQESFQYPMQLSTLPGGGSITVTALVSQDKTLNLAQSEANQSYKDRVAA